MEGVMRRLMLLVMLAVTVAGRGQNLLVNGDFETNAPTTNGVHVGWPTNGWTLAPGTNGNVVQVDGPGGFNYGLNGAECDASIPCLQVPQHYFDIAGGKNTLYQTFKAGCEGTIELGGSFSTEQNKGGTGSITLYSGAGLGGSVVGTVHTVTVPGGNSQTDPWTNVTYTAAVPAGTYTYAVTLDDNLDFANAFVHYTSICDASDCMAGGVREVSCNGDGTFSVTLSVTNNTGNPTQYI